MTFLQIGLLGAFVLVQVCLLGCTEAQGFGEQCLAKFEKGRTDFILDTDESVNEGATFVASPKVENWKDCVRSCCKDPRCNVAFMEAGASEGAIKSCFLFDCLYKQKYVCRFVRKTGFINYFLDTVYKSDIAAHAKVPSDVLDHPPLAKAGQDRVVQPQDSVTLNGIESKDDHGIDSYLWKLVSGNPSAVMEKTNFDDQVIVSNLSSGIYKFQLTVTDTIGQSHSTQVTILVLTPEQSEDHCMVPMKIGPCRGSFPRWHYNGASEKCEEFMFGGCRENLNNYLSSQECENACYGSSSGGKSGRLGPLPSAKGEVCGAPCRPEQFTCANDCCLDPGLECDKEAQCSDGSDEASCEYLNDKFRILLQIPVDEQKVRCTGPPDTGSCREGFSKWYYNPIHRDCFRFNYGGCPGNENRFDTKETCMKTCQSVTENDIFSNRERFEYREDKSQMTSIIVAALLGLAIVILLVVLCYCFMKGKKQQPQHMPLNSSQVTTMEDRERLVYNTTTKPV